MHGDILGAAFEPELLEADKLAHGPGKGALHAVLSLPEAVEEEDLRLGLELLPVDVFLGGIHAGKFPVVDGHLFEIEALGGGFGLPFGFQAIAKLLKFLGVFAGEDDPAGAKAVTQGVEANGGLSLGSFGASRQKRVATIGLDLLE
ncbi:MAG TPA: hypothetical protein VE959_37930 [Bryobacteraceae bacterium]|nr:hypothetical protein [Bryobacteraceae bacterium]